MEEGQLSQQIDINEAYEYAARLYVGGFNSYEVKESLLQKGINEHDAIGIIDSLEQEIKGAQRSRAKKEMLYGALWCIGGTVLTLAHIGFIFWGAIIFGAIQFIRGAVSLK